MSLLLLLPGRRRPARGGNLSLLLDGWGSVGPIVQAALAPNSPYDPGQTAAPPIAATAAITLDALTVSGAGQLLLEGGLDQTLGALTVSSVGSAGGGTNAVAAEYETGGRKRRYKVGRFTTTDADLARQMARDLATVDEPAPKAEPTKPAPGSGPAQPATVKPAVGAAPPVVEEAYRVPAGYFSGRSAGDLVAALSPNVNATDVQKIAEAIEADDEEALLVALMGRRGRL